MTWVLILFAHVGMMGKTDSNSLQVVDGFSSKATCEAAGSEAKRLVTGTVKSLEFVCVAKK